MEKTAESLDWIMKALVKEQMGTGQAPAVFKTKEQRQKEGRAGLEIDSDLVFDHHVKQKQVVEELKSVYMIEA